MVKAVKFENRWYQIESEHAVFDYLKKTPDGHPLVALPTGSGKTAVMNKIVHRIFRELPDAKVVVVSHEQEILKQNKAALERVHPVSVNSSGLGERKVGKLTVAGIQSVFRSADEFADFDWIIIDEAHTIPTSDTSMYRQFFKGVGKHTRIGLTATPYRLGQGYIIGDDHMFTKIVIDLTFGSKFTRLVKEGFISPLTSKAMDTTFNAEDIKMQGGDYSLKEMSTKFDRKSITDAALNEMVTKAGDRNKWLVFAIDIDHADHICDGLNSRGINSMVVHSNMDFNRDFVIGNYRLGRFKCIVNVGMLTTGFDAPDIDMIGLLRPTQSPGLHVQMIGRGLRVAEGKKDCLVLDYAGNTARLGPINRIKPRVKGKGKSTGEPITKTCEKCDTIVTPMTKICPTCGAEFKFKQLINTSAAGDDIVQESGRHWFKVKTVEYDRHYKKNSTPSIAVKYHCGLRIFKEWVCPDHKGYAGGKGRNFIIKRGGKHETLELSIEYLRQTEPPKRILVQTDSKYPEVLDYEF